jgi:hypothetical protein
MRKYFIALNREDFATLLALIDSHQDKEIASILDKAKKFSTNPIETSKTADAIMWDSNIIMNAPWLV